MRSLRAENLKLTNDKTRLTEKHAEAQRKADIATAAETTLKTQLKSAEAHAKALKEEVARMKSLVAQSRASCATEIRRRDRQIDTLKKQLGEAGRSRGSKGNPAITTITVTGEIGHERDSMTLGGSPTNHDTELRSETNTTLANLAQHLTEENDTLLGVMQRAMAQLQDMSGWTGDGKEDAHVIKRPNSEDMAADLDSIMDHMRTILTNPSFVPIEEVMLREEEINRLKTGWMKMETRWKDAVHLIDGWRKRMAASGKPVCDEELQMGLRLSPVRVNDVEETRGGAVPLSVVKEESEEQDENLMCSPCPIDRERRRPIFAVPGEEGDDDNNQAYADSESGTEYEDNAAVDDYAATTKDEELEHLEQGLMSRDLGESLESLPLPEQPQLSPLRNSSSAGNRGFLRNEKLRSRPSGRTETAETNTQNQSSEPKSMRSLPVRPRSLAPQTRLPSRVQKPSERPRSPSRTSLDEALLPKRDNESVEPEEVEDSGKHSRTADRQDDAVHAKTTAREQRHPSSRVTSQTRLARTTEPQPQQSPLTMSNIAAKLAASEKEADAARVRAKLRAARGSARGVAKPTTTKPTESGAPVPSIQQAENAACDAGNGDPVKEVQAPQEEDKPEKRKRDRKASKTASRRRSTLSPWELETLISGNGQ